MSAGIFDIVDGQYVYDHMDTMPLVDVRPAEMYAEGHIPGAISIPLQPVLEKTDNYLDDAAVMLGGAFKAAGIMPGDDVIVYCRSGHMATMACMLLHAVGYSALHCYRGSWLDWTANTANPIEK